MDMEEYAKAAIRRATTEYYKQRDREIQEAVDDIMSRGKKITKQ